MGGVRGRQSVSAAKNEMNQKKGEPAVDIREGRGGRARTHHAAAGAFPVSLLVDRARAIRVDLSLARCARLLGLALLLNFEPLLEEFHLFDCAELVG